MEEQHNIVHAHPSKTFFIDMLTRDITLIACILDLVDNSLHNVVRVSNLDVMDILLGKDVPKVSAEISISFNEREFEIRDTSGGITIADAEDLVFLFGSNKREKHRPGLGVYGIGMKRAFFKIGRDISVDSVTDSEEFLVRILVDEWERKKEWDLEFTYARERSGVTGRRKPGTVIKINKINGPIRRHFSTPNVLVAELMKRIGTTYALFIKAGVKISVNDRLVPADLPSMAESKEIRTHRQMFKHDGVDILVMAGITPKEDNVPRGWYVFCNGRMVIEADKTVLTGWDDRLPSFQPKYNHFLGYVYFRSRDVLKLPWKTTKDGVEQESEVYQAALNEMGVVGKPITSFFNNMYPSTPVAEGAAERDAMHGAKAVSVETVAKRHNLNWSFKPAKKTPVDLVNIQYRRTRADVEKARAAIGRRLSASAIGDYTFDYFLGKEG